MTLGKRIKAARERLKPKLTQSDLGKFFKVTDKAVSGWERDETVPDPRKLAELAKRLKVPCQWLLEGTCKPPAPDALEVAIEELTPRERALIESMIAAIRRERNNAA